MVDELAELIVSVGETKSSKDKYNGAKVGGHTLQKVEGLRAIKKIWDKAIKEIEKGKKEKEKGMKCLRCGGRDFKEYDLWDYESGKALTNYCCKKCDLCFDSKTGFWVVYGPCYGPPAMYSDLSKLQEGGMKSEI